MMKRSKNEELMNRKKKKRKRKKHGTKENRWRKYETAPTWGTGVMYEKFDTLIMKEREAWILINDKHDTGRESI